LHLAQHGCGDWLLPVDVAVGSFIALINELKFRILVIEPCVLDTLVCKGDCRHLAVKSLVFVALLSLVVTFHGTESCEETNDPCLSLLREFVDPQRESEFLTEVYPVAKLFRVVPQGRCVDGRSFKLVRCIGVSVDSPCSETRKISHW
jgi:hypothetical protein